MSQRTLITIFFGLLLLVFPAVALAHCDSLDGPVIKDARLALKKKDVTPALKWVKKEFEPEVRAAFAKALSARDEATDLEFFETLVRIHRQGEGAPYTGIKPAGSPVEPGIAAADRALDSNSVKIAENAIREQVREGLAQAYQRVVATRKHKDDSVEAGRAYVEAYVAFVHYVERLYEDATSTPVHAEEGALHAHVDPH